MFYLMESSNGSSLENGEAQTYMEEKNERRSSTKPSSEGVLIRKDITEDETSNSSGRARKSIGKESTLSTILITSSEENSSSFETQNNADPLQNLQSANQQDNLQTSSANNSDIKENGTSTEHLRKKSSGKEEVDRNSLEKGTEATYSKSSSVEINSPNAEYLVHKITRKENLQGIAVKYGVQIADIKKLNRLWTNNDLFSRKEILIPISAEGFMEMKEQSPRSKSPPYNNQFAIRKKAQLTEKFVTITKCEDDLAQFFLESNNWNFSKALGSYHQQTNTSSQSEKDKNKEVKKPKQRMTEDEDIWISDDEKQSPKSNNESFVYNDDSSLMLNRKSVKAFQNGEIVMNSAPTYGRPVVGTVKKRTQEKFQEEENSMFNL